MTDTIIIPSNPKDLERIKKAVVEAANCLTRIDAEKDELKSIADVLHEELKLPKAVFNKMVRIYHKQELEKYVSAASDIEEFYKALKL